MNCRDFEADIVDLARGAESSAGAAERLREHLGGCAACAARLAREQQLTAGLKAVAASAPASPRSASIEADLLRAFADRHTAAPQRNPARRPALASPVVRAWLAAAAVLVLAVAVWQGTSRWQPGDEAQPAPAGLAAQPAPAQTAARLPAPEPAGADAADDAVLPAPQPPDDGGTPVVAPTGVRASRGGARADAPAGGDDVMRFVQLPTAIGMPELESGRIVRVELQTAMLPAYGLDVVPDLAGSTVEADVLVGQDGQPRAIRFVSLESDPRRRQ